MTSKSSNSHHHKSKHEKLAPKAKWPSLKVFEKLMSNAFGWVVVALVILMVLQFFNSLRISSAIDTLQASNGELIDNMALTTEFVSNFGNDLNEVRRYLLLPENDYNYTLVSEEEITADEPVDEDPIVSLFSYIDKLGQEEQREKLYGTNLTLLNDYMGNYNTATHFLDYGLSIVTGIKYHLVDGDYNHLISMSVEEDGTFLLENYSGEIELTDNTSFDVFKSTLDAYLQNDLGDLKRSIVELNATREMIAGALYENADVQAALDAQSLGISDERETDGAFVYDLASQDGTVLGSIDLSKATGQVTAEETSLPTTSQAEFAAELVYFIQTFDGRNPLLIQVDEIRSAIEALEGDEGFKSQLDQAGLIFDFTEVETADAIEYNIYNLNNELVKILYISTETGELLVRDPDDPIGTLLSYALTAEKKTLELPDVVEVSDEVIDEDDQINILVAGKHGSLTDTMIFTNIDTTTNEITLISIPRDLHYNQRKINGVYAYFGMDELLRQLSDILGYKIDQYILVDMYVFIDLIDLVGGVDVVLEEDLIDPTYRTVENGRESTLYYAAGEHHMTGVEALRIARSRHSTSDYSRAERQQIILAGLHNKAKNLGFGDAATVIGLIKTILEQTDTNIPLDDAIRYYFTFQNYEMNKGHVMSTANVLESVMVPVSTVTSAQTQVCSVVDGQQVCKTQYAMYTSQPRGGNWDYIKWWVNDILADDGDTVEET